MSLYDINGEKIESGAGNQFFDTVTSQDKSFSYGNPYLNKGTDANPSTSGKTESELQGKFYDAKYNDWDKALNGGTYGVFGSILLYPMGEGTHWIRIVTNSLNPDIRFYCWGNPDIGTNPTQQLDKSILKVTRYLHFDWEDCEGNQNVGVCANLGAWTNPDSGSMIENAYVALYKLEVPSGVYAFLTPYGNGSYYPVSNDNYNIDGLYTIFSYDPSGNILEIPSEDNSETLEVKKEYKQGFEKSLLSDGIILSTIIPAYGKKMVMFGDSLTAYAGGDGRTGEGFLTQINKYLQMDAISNMGYAGSTWSGSGTGDCPARINKLVSEGTNYDVIVLAWGTNSDTNNGTIDDVASESGSMVAVMKWAINTIRSNFPDAGLGILIPPEGVSGMNGDTKADLMIDVCKLMRVPYLDMYYGGNIIQNNDVTGGLGSDQVHLYRYGRDRYASALLPFVQRLCPLK